MTHALDESRGVRAGWCRWCQNNMHSNCVGACTCLAPHSPISSTEEQR